MWVKSKSHSVVSDSLQPHGIYSPRNSPGQNTGVDSHALLQGIFPTQGSNPHLPNCRRILHQLSHQGSPQMWELDHKEGFALKNWCFRTVVLEKTLESPLDSKEIKQVNPKGNQSWILFGSWSSNTLATWWKQLTYWKRPWCWERLQAEGEEGDRGWDGWMASPIQWTWTWANSVRRWGAGKPGVLSPWGRVGHNLATEQQQTHTIASVPDKSQTES